MLISIIIPSYNYANYIGKAIDSVLEQVDDNEIIIVDDGSKDQTRAVIEPYLENPNVRYIYQENRGVSAARNHGVSAAQGEYVIFVDADDRLLPGALTTVRAHIAQHPDIDCFLAGYTSVNATGRRRTSYPGKLGKKGCDNLGRFIQKKIGIIASGATVFRRTVFDTIKYPESVHNNEDIAVLAHTLTLYNCMSIHKPILEVTRHDDSLSHNPANLAESALLLPDIVFNPEFVPEDCMSLKKEYTARLNLSRFRSFYLARQYKLARKYYHRAIKLLPGYIFSSYTKKFLLSFVAGLRNH